MIGPTAAFLAATMAWVAQVTGLPPAPTPRVTLARSSVDGTPLEHSAADDGRFHAAAETVPGHVYLNLGWHQNDPIDDCILAHELVHVLQFNAGQKACVEPLAWFTEAYCLEQRGIDFYRAKGLTPRDAVKAWRCAG